MTPKVGFPTGVSMMGLAVVVFGKLPCLARLRGVVALATFPATMGDKPSCFLTSRSRTLNCSASNAFMPHEDPLKRSPLGAFGGERSECDGNRLGHFLPASLEARAKGLETARLASSTTTLGERLAERRYCGRGNGSLGSPYIFGSAFGPPAFCAPWLCWSCDASAER